MMPIWYAVITISLDYAYFPIAALLVFSCTSCLVWQALHFDDKGVSIAGTAADHSTPSIIIDEAGASSS